MTLASGPIGKVPWVGGVFDLGLWGISSLKGPPEGGDLCARSPVSASRFHKTRRRRNRERAGQGLQRPGRNQSPPADSSPGGHAIAPNLPFPEERVGGGGRPERALKKKCKWARSMIKGGFFRFRPGRNGMPGAVDRSFARFHAAFASPKKHTDHG